MNADLALHVGVASLCIIIVLGVLHKAGWLSPKFGLAGLGVGIAALGVYLFPAGNIEAYDLTRNAWSLTDSLNSVFWYVFTTLLILAGIGIVLLSRRSNA